MARRDVVTPGMRQRKGTLSFFMVAGAAFAIVGFVMLGIGLTSGNFISNMGLTITGGTFAMIGVIWVAVAVGVGGWYGSVARKQAEEQQLFQTGERATAVIEGVEGTGVEINNQPQVYLTLRVQPRNGQEFIHQRKLTLPFGSVLQPGYLVDVAYDPANPDRVAIESDPRYVTTPPAIYIKTRPPDGAAQPVHAFTSSVRQDAPVAMSAPAAGPPSDGSPPTLIEQIERLAKLRDSGALTEAEFQQQKKELLEG